MTLVQQVENVVDLARRITLVVRTDKNVLNISIVNRFLAFPQIFFDHLLVVSVQQIAFCLSCSTPYTQIKSGCGLDAFESCLDYASPAICWQMIFCLLVQNTRQRLFLVKEMFLPMPCPFATMSKVMANSRTVIILQLYLALHSICPDRQVLGTKWLISLCAVIVDHISCTSCGAL